MKFDLISYKGVFPKIEKDVIRSSTSTAIGNTVLGSKCILKDRVVLSYRFKENLNWNQAYNWV